MSRSENQSPATVEVHGQMAIQIILELVATAREIPHHRQGRSSSQVVQSAPKLLGAGGAIGPLGCLVVIADLRQSGFRKDNVHSTDM
jgi:hypothetical protein